MKLSCYIHRNPLRAGIIARLAEYPWSSYKAYAYGGKAPEWLLTKPILDQFDSKDKHRAYREKVQQYANEENRLFSTRQSIRFCVPHMRGDRYSA